VSSRVTLCVLALAAGLGCRGVPIPEGQRFPAGTPLVPRTVMIGGTQIRYVSAGTGTAVVFLHGLAASIYAWRYTLMPVAAAGYRVVAFDNRGFGFSDKPSTGYSNAEYTALVVALLDSLGVSDAVLVGHSMGGAIAVEVALAHHERIRGLVLIDPAGLGVRWPFLLRAAGWPVIGRLLDWLRGRRSTELILKAMYANPRLVTAQDVDQYYAPVATPGFSRALRGVLREFRFDALGGRMAALVPPTLVLWGAQDRLIPPTIGLVLVAELPHGAFVRIPGAGHAAVEEQPQFVNRTLLAFLKQGLPRVPENLAWSPSSSR